MFFIRFLRWLLGWVRLETEGGFPEKLLNGAAKAGFSLWNSCRQGVRMTTCCYARQYKKLRPLAKKACVRMRVLERHGLPFFLHRYRARAGIAAGVLIYALLLQFLSGRIWIVNIEGNDQVPEASIREVLEPLGVQEGGDFRKLDVPSLQLTALQSLPDLTWLAVNLEGSTVSVKVRERGSHAPMEDGAFPSNIKAARDGRVLKIEVTGGQAMVQAGDAVTRDTLLISGVVESKTGPLLRRSSGRVIAETSRTLTAEVPLEETLLLPTGDSIFRPVFTLFGIRVPLFTDGAIPKDHVLETHRHMLTAYGKVLPVGFVCDRYALLEPSPVSRTEEEAAALAAALLDERERAELGRAEITSSNRDGRVENGVYILTGTYACIEDIGVEEQIYLDEAGAGG